MEEETVVAEPNIEAAAEVAEPSIAAETAVETEPAAVEQAVEVEQAPATKAKEKPWYVRKMDEKDALIARQEKLLEAALALAQKQGNAEPKIDAAVDVGPQRDQFNSDEDYYGARFRWEVRNEAAAAAREAARQVAAQTVSETKAERARLDYMERVAKFAAEAPDYNEVVGSATDVELPDFIEGTIITSPKGPQIAYELAQMNREDPDGLKSLFRMPPALAMLEIGQRLAMKAVAKTTPMVKPAPVTKAPAPITTVATRAPLTFNLETATPAEIRTHLEAQGFHLA